MEFVGHVKSVLDAFILAEAVRQGQVKGVQVRPEINERSKIYGGMTILYNETKTGIKRWTDGRVWSTSKFYNGFFIYEDKTLTSSTEVESDTTGILNNSMRLFKKVITIVSPNNETLHLINYFYHNSPRDENLDSNLIRPVNCLFRQRDSIIDNAKKYRYYKCFRSKSDLFKKLYYAPEVEYNLDIDTTVPGKFSNSSRDVMPISPNALTYSFDDKSYPNNFINKALTDSPVSNIHLSNITLPPISGLLENCKPFEYKPFRATFDITLISKLDKQFLL